MRRLQHTMPRSINRRALPLSVVSPKHKHDRMLTLIHRTHNSVCEVLPTLTLMRTRRTPLNREHVIEPVSNTHLTLPTRDLV